MPAIQACHAVTPLQHEELRALWPLIVARAAVLVLSSEQQQRLDPDNSYLLKNAEHEWEIFHVATSVPFELMEAAILGCVGQAPAPIASQGFAPLLPGLVGREFALIDLGVLSPHFEAGNWEQPGVDQRLLQEAAAVHGLAASRYGQYRLSRTQPDSANEPETFPLHVELQVPLGTVHVQRMPAMRDVIGVFVAGLPVREEWRGRAIEIRHACLLIVSDSGGAGHAGACAPLPACKHRKAWSDVTQLTLAGLN